MLSTRKFKEMIEEKKYEIIEDDNEFKIIKNKMLYAIVGISEQRSTTFRNTPSELRKLIRRYEDTKVKDRSGYYQIPLKNLTLGEQKYIVFNRIKEEFGVMDNIIFTNENITQIFTKEEIESDFFQKTIGDYLKYVEEV